MLAPIAVLMPSTGRRPDGWSETALFEPVWWTSTSLENEREAKAGIESKPVKQPALIPEPRSLFDLPKLVAVQPLDNLAPPPKIAEPSWLIPLLESPMFANQKNAAGRSVVSDEFIRNLLVAITNRGGKILRLGLARHLNLPPLRLPGVIAAARRMLNFDGVDVLSVDEASDSVVLDIEKLKVQFDLP